MAYRSINEMFGSISLRDRITAAIAQEVPGIDPVGAVNTYMWPLVARSDWITKWDNADRSLDFNPDLGARPSLITDTMILGAVQAIRDA